MDIVYEQLADEQLAEKLSLALGLSPESSLRAIRSSAPELGREWAISVLEQIDRFDKTQERLTRHRESLRSLALGV